ncbi:hypothetical protein CC1G_14527 [Coprinopsis cinerea okayama7|uniref:Uncharacterized protein n=1 Tax=Coprinopsis cinerea (strain Okayama-7 / 130 / ATCC MYA-4618 / FGSC 9003) TaxID=240176 RepID=D6RMX5_COPC7|nr:hypothetical protein CC1G_14527 [Coprinopsis cinerea okayama7\|eukprot:XP_002911095.1 hypothetical protein CC1G_14527 [Coprinopsis cinerea okayama7\
MSTDTAQGTTSNTTNNNNGNAATSSTTTTTNVDPTTSPILASPTGQARTNHELAQLLAQAYAEIDVLRRELSQTKRRADKAERLATTLSAAAENTNGSSSSTPVISEAAARIIRDLEERISLAEHARDEAESRRRLLIEQWSTVESYLGHLEYKAQETRANFGRVLKEGGVVGGGVVAGTLQSLPPMPPPSVPSSSKSSRHRQGHNHVYAPVFPPAAPGLRRPRTPSLDSAYPPPKRSRGNDDTREPRVSYNNEPVVHGLPPHPSDPSYHRQHPPIRVIQTGEKHAGRPSHSRSSSRSSASSMDVDEMLLRTTTDDRSASQPNGAGAASASPHPHPASINPLHHIQSSHRSRHSRSQPRSGVPLSESEYQQQQQYPRRIDTYPASQSIPLRKEHTVQSPAQLQTYQTHIFAPPVTGAPIKKSKYSSANLAAHGSVVGLDSQSPNAPPVPAFPATNAQGQRICRQCGQAGRYKDGKCVEKWGPGPLGPGTVCDRCRKKMKRVERRGTLEAQQQAAQAQQLAAAATMSSVSQSQQHHDVRSLQRTDTIPANASPTTSAREKPGSSATTSATTTTAAAAPATSSSAANNPPKVSHVRTAVSGADAGGARSGSRSAPTTNGNPSSSSSSLARSSLHHGSARSAAHHPPSTSSSHAATSSSRPHPSNNTGSAGGGNQDRSPPIAIAHTRSPVDVTMTDSDADADAEAEAEAEILGAVEASSSANHTTTTAPSAGTITGKDGAGRGYVGGAGKSVIPGGGGGGKSVGPGGRIVAYPGGVGVGVGSDGDGDGDGEDELLDELGDAEGDVDAMDADGERDGSGYRDGDGYGYRDGERDRDGYGERDRDVDADGDGEGEVEGEDGDAEAELLEAVDAAERNSSGGSSRGV